MSTVSLDSPPVTDPFGIAADAALGDMARALDPVHMAPRLEAALRDFRPGSGPARLQEIRVVRHKPGRRCLIEYRLETATPDGSRELTLIAKARAKHRPETVFERQRALSGAGFAEDSADGVSVPDAIACFPELNLWLQHKVAGVPSGELFGRPGAEPLGARIAEAARKVHRCGVPTKRSHAMADELRILHERLPEVVRQRPEWSGRIGRLLAACDRLGASVAAPVATGIHRDFYQDQVIVSGERLFLIDFDLYCIGDPGVDIGNFLAHVEEQALRETGDLGAYRAFAGALRERYLELAGSDAAAAVDAYAQLTLVRHVYLSTLFPQRQPFTATLLELSEQRLARWM
ncbi:MAG TPA: phosphotransferase [Rhodocyclaceae bacterium]|nr:phosphotransferase [Rhodocyclaceae bacterium]